MDAQRSRFEGLVKQNRWQSLGFFPETGSGTSVINRPVLCNILQRIQNGGGDALWVKKTDRLSRPENLGDLSLISQTLEGSNTLLMVDTRSMDLREDNPVLMLDFEGVLAKHFRRQLLRNMNRGKVRKAEMGRKAGGQAFSRTNAATAGKSNLCHLQQRPTPSPRNRSRIAQNIKRAASRW